MWIFYLVIFLLVLALIVLSAMYFKDKSFRKEISEVFITVFTSVKDGHLTEEEKLQIKKEWEDIDWKTAFNSLLIMLKNKV
jgi:hypothetical protein